MANARSRTFGEAGGTYVRHLRATVNLAVWVDIEEMDVFPYLKNLRPAEQIALSHLAQARSNREIAELMGLSQNAIIVLFEELADQFGVPGQNEVAELAQAALRASGQSKLSST